MFRKIGIFKPQPLAVNCILMNGGLGDHIGSLVAVNYILKTYPWIKLLIWVPDYLLELAKNLLPKNSEVNDYTSMQEKYDRELITIHTEWDGRTSPMKMHSVDYAFIKLCDQIPDIFNKNYLKINSIDINKFNLPKDYVVVCTGYTAKVREFEPNTVNKVVDFIKENNLQAVFLGQTETTTGSKHVIQGNFSEEIRYEEGINLINKTSLVEAASIMQGAYAVVGVDCGLLHLAGCTNVPIVGGFTTVNPELRMPIRNNTLGWNFWSVVPESFLDCKFCQAKTNFLYGHDYKNCLYNDYLCVKQLTANKFIDKIKKIENPNIRMIKA